MDARHELLDALLDDARQSTEDLARQLGLDEAEVETLIADLESEGVVRGYQAVVDWREVEGEHVQAELELNVELDRETGYSDIASRIAQFPEVRSLRLVSGNYDFAVDLEADSMDAINQFVSERVAPIPEVTQTVTHFVMDVYKERGIVFDRDRDDDRLSVSP